MPLLLDYEIMEWLLCLKACRLSQAARAGFFYKNPPAAAAATAQAAKRLLVLGSFSCPKRSITLLIKK
jgi:hypothetical protein